MLFATTSADTVFFLLIAIPLAFHGFRKMGRWFDDKGEVKEATKQGVLGLIGKFFKK